MVAIPLFAMTPFPHMIFTFAFGGNACRHWKITAFSCSFFDSRDRLQYLSPLFPGDQPDADAFANPFYRTGDILDHRGIRRGGIEPEKKGLAFLYLVPFIGIRYADVRPAGIEGKGLFAFAARPRTRDLDDSPSG